ncbi:aminotransferase class I/II-fold pyridoxal phosphate-dependent enzyme [Dendronalium sp. ChiSLP03b]|uniref:aminotransferase class I/II-fold pyridoxal phosphate-dependent enzyme n=1 Tax=Dendronalium sp. ChiSLP03b TaxID=3075381 RepID=UPI002AD26886|nr:aminotransferase class I/II-fold pyridoxal phosphate-dependent enzyme [Dendronalium sp. ChiSLP03b]MDZ8205225.1 aminotransferase class I/II-fold pyridoxal phosphate-dependent enzyme [Dendronalium sp. ChiSLP03b]
MTIVDSGIKSDFLVPGKTLIDLLHQRVKQQPHHEAYIFLQDGEIETNRLTYQELESQVKAIAAHLQSLGSPGDRALLLYPPGLDFIAGFFACLYAGIVAVPAYPPKRNQKLSRLQAIVRDARATLLLTTAEMFQVIEQYGTNEPTFKQLHWILSDRIATPARDFIPITVESNSLALLQYTSGSTGTPKGVMVSHGNLMHNCTAILQFLGKTPNVGFSWLPPYHDMGLIGGILQPVSGGFTGIFMPPMAFLQNPMRWLKGISTYKATVSGGPNFAYDLCVQNIKSEQLENLDLSSWEIALNGAEPIRSETIESFTKLFSPYGFRLSSFQTCYGMAETTLLVTGVKKAEVPTIKVCDTKALEQNQVVSCTATDVDRDQRKLVSCGHPWLNQTVAIVDPVSLTECETGQVGEIWVAGESVAQGYWNRAEETQKTFGAYFADSGEGPFLRTGDLGFWQDEAGLFVTGRLKDLLVIRGRNHYPQDIEQTVETSHPGLGFHSSAAFTVEIDGSDRLIVVCEVKRTYLRNLDAKEVVKTIRQSVLREHELQVYRVLLLKPGTLPKTSSGKIQRFACRENFLTGNLLLVTSEPPDTQPIHLNEYPQQYSVESIQNWICQWLAAKLNIPIQSIDQQESFETYGLDSMQVAQFIQDLQAWSGYLANISTLQTFGAIATFAQYLAQELARQNNQPLTEIPPEYYQFECFPEYAQLQQRLTHIQTLEIPNPYFQMQESLTRDCTQVRGHTLINYSTYNYLGLSGDPAVSAAAKDAIDRYGTSVGASRLASGERLLHRELEQEIAEFIGVEDCIVYVSGHATNVTTIGHLFNSQDLIFYDALSHNSILQGCSLSGAKAIPFPHNDWQALDEMLQDQRQHYRRVLIVIEGIYSMDGDIPDLPRFIELKQQHKALLMVDEAHSIGVLGQQGRGISEFFGVQPADVDLWMGTLSKAFASCGGYIAGSKALVNYLKYTAPGFVYSVGLSPANTAAALAALRLLKADPTRVKTLHQRSQHFLTLAKAKGWNTATSQNSPIIPIVLGNSLTCIQLSHILFQAGINVQPIIYPAVANHAARLRFFISSLHTKEQINATIAALAIAFTQVPHVDAENV